MEAKPNELSQDTQHKIHSMCLKQSSDEALQDDFGLFIPPSGANTRYAKSTFDLAGAVNDFIEGDKRVLLILGESGCGKSFFSQTLIKRKSEVYHSGDRVPIFISLPSLRSAKTSVMGEALGLQGFSLEEVEVLRKTQKFLIVFDAYDELNSFDNLYMTNNMVGWDAKIMITCRIDYMTQDSNYQCYFMPYLRQKPLENAFQELFVAPFVRGQIERYIVQYLAIKRNNMRADILMRPELVREWLLPKTYEAWIEKLPGLKELVCQPFLLRITMEVLPEVIVELQSMTENQDKYKITSAKLYDHFVNQWFVRQKNKLSIKLISQGEYVSPTFQKDCMDFAKALGKKMNEKKIDVVNYEDQTSGFADEESMGRNIHKDMAQWAVFFSDEMLPQDRGSEERRQNRIRIRKASLLKKLSANQWAFMHASLRDYFMALNIAGPKMDASQELKSPRSGQISPRPDPGVGVVERFNLSRRKLSHAASHRVVGFFSLLNRIDQQEAEELLRDEGVKVDFNSGEVNKRVIIGRGSFGKLRIARHLYSHRFAGVKKIRGEMKIKGSAYEAEFQRELNGLPNVMPIWDSQMIKSKKTKEDVLLQFMPLAGFGNGGQLVELIGYIENENLKRQFLVHLLKSLLTGVKGMHSRRVFHLDIKLPNIVLDIFGDVYFIDFGCAYREYGNKNDALISGGRGDYEYFSPDRLSHNKKNSQKQIADDKYKPEHYDGEKADIWAVGISLLKFYMQDLHFMSGVGTSSDWITYLTEGFESVPRWVDAAENSILGCIKTLLRFEPEHRPSAAESLKNSLFLDPQNQLSQEALQDLMLLLIKWKTDPPQQSVFELK